MNATRGRADRTSSGGGWYVYGVVPATEARVELFGGVDAVAGGAVGILDEGRLAAVVSEVPLAEFSEGALAENLRDPVWLERHVRAHEAVLEAALGVVPVVPFRFGTIYTSKDQVRKMLRDHEQLEQSLDRVRGKVEFGVKGFVAAAPPDPSERDEPQRELSAGRRYLEEKHRARRRAEEREALRAQFAQESHERLASAANEATANAVQPPEVSGREEQMFLNGAYLVAGDREQEFRAALAALEAEHGARGALYELTGPWPPYNFVGEAA